MVTDLFTIPFSGGPAAEGEFVGGPENRPAAAVVEQLAEGDCAISPLVFYGPSGVGKTHLALGLASRLECEKPSATIAIITGADYARGYAEACRADSVDEFSRGLRQSDWLVLDAACQLAGKMAAQLHLARTLDVVHQRGGMVIATLRHCPAAGGPLLAPLASRLLSGWTVAMMLPSEATRRAVAHYMAGRLQVRLQPPAAALLAQRLRGGVRQIQTAIAQLASRASDDITSRDVQALLAEQHSHEVPALSSIAATTARRLRVKLSDMRGPSRRTAHVRARGIAMLAARRLAGMSYGRIGAYFGGRDHTTVMHACGKTEKLLDTDCELADLWHQLVSSIGEHRDSSPGFGAAAE